MQFRVLSKDERVGKMIGLLFYEPDYLTIRDIADTLLISRSTVANDLSDAEKWLEAHHVKLIKKPKLGLKIYAGETAYRSAWMAFIHEELGHEALWDIAYAPGYVQGSSFRYQYAQRLSRGIHTQEIKLFLFRVSSELGIIYSDETLCEVMAYFCIAIKRMQRNQKAIVPRQMIEKIINSDEYKSAARNITALEAAHNVIFEEIELYQVTVQLISAKVKDTNSDASYSKSELAFIRTYIKEIGARLGIDLTGDSVLEKNLLIHIRPTLNRLRYSLMIINPILDQIRQTYPFDFNVVKSVTKKMEKVIGFPINDDEIGYLTMHIVCAAERNKKKEKAKKIRAVVACASSIGTSKLLSSRLRTEFEEIEIVNEISISQIDQYIDDVDLVITTTPVSGILLKPVIMVSPLVDASDIEKIKKAIGSLNGKEAPSVRLKVEEIVGIVNQYCKISDVEELTRALETKIYGKKNIVKQEDQKLLLEMIDLGRIQTQVPAKDKNDAIRKAGALLMKDGFITSAYIDAMIRLTEELNAYIVIAPAVAMPHARPEEGALKTGFSMITLKDPIRFGHEKNDPVKIVIALSAVDNVGHLKAMRELSMLISDEEAFAKLLNSRTGEEMIEVLSELEQKFINKQKERG